MTFINMLRDESGASAAEYALILAIVGSAIAVAALTLGNTISTSIDGASARIAACTVGADGETVGDCEPEAAPTAP